MFDFIWMDFVVTRVDWYFKVVLKFKKNMLLTISVAE